MRAIELSLKGLIKLLVFSSARLHHDKHPYPVLSSLSIPVEVSRREDSNPILFSRLLSIFSHASRDVTFLSDPRTFIHDLHCLEDTLRDTHLLVSPFSSPHPSF